MSAPKSDRHSRAKKPARRFSLITPEAQRAIYQAVSSLPSSHRAARSAEIAEAAVCLAVGAKVPVVMAGMAPGTRTVRKDAIRIRSSNGRCAAATMAALNAMMQQPEAQAAVICAGELDSSGKAQEDWRAAFRFAAQQRLPLIFVVANRLGARSPQVQDLRSLHPEFGMHVFSVDANDAIAAYRVATEAMHHIRQRRGPSVVEALCVPAPPNGQAHAPLELLAAYMRLHGNPEL